MTSLKSLSLQILQSSKSTTAFPAHILAAAISNIQDISPGISPGATAPLDHQHVKPVTYSLPDSYYNHYGNCSPSDYL